MKYSIREGDIPTAVRLSRALPEFADPHGEEEYCNRLEGVPFLILVAEVAGEPVGFKVGYEREGAFYSWMGGVLPAYRRWGIAQALADAQERWALENGYAQIIFKTRNRHKAMLIFALKNGFEIIGFSAGAQPAEHRILLRKSLK